MGRDHGQIKGDNEPRTGEPDEKNEARKSKPAREQLIFEFPPLARCQVGISHVSNNCPIGVKRNVNKDDSALHAHGDFRGGWSNFMDDAVS